MVGGGGGSEESVGFDLQSLQAPYYSTSVLSPLPFDNNLAISFYER